MDDRIWRSVLVGVGVAASRYVDSLLRFCPWKIASSWHHADQGLEMPLADPNMPNQYNTVSSLSAVLFDRRTAEFTVPPDQGNYL